MKLDDLAEQYRALRASEYHLHAIGWMSGQHTRGCLPSDVQATAIIQESSIQFYGVFKSAVDGERASGKWIAVELDRLKLRFIRRSRIK